MAAADDQTAPIDLTTGRRRSFRTRRETSEDAAPRAGEAKHTPSSLIEDAFQASAEMGSVYERGEQPSPELLKRVRDGVHVFRLLREHTSVFDRAGAGGGGGRGSLLLTVAACLGITLGVPGLTSADDIAQARVIAESTAKALEVQQERVDALEKREDEKDRSMRRNLGLTIRWLGDEQERACRNSQAIAGALNWIGRRETRRGDEFAEIQIDCDASKLIPPELEVLRANARDDLGQ